MKKTHLIILFLFLTSAIIITAAVITYKALTVPKSKKYVVETIEANSKDYIKVGIISDAQLPQVEKHLYGWDYSTVMNGADHLIKALKYYKSQNVDMIVFNGDMVNATGDYAAYSAYNKILDYVYGEDRAEAPHIIYPMGNHEFYGGNQEHNFYKSTGLPLNTRTIVNGYSFISISNSKLEKGDEELAESNDTLADGTYNEKRIEFLKEQLAAANTEDPNKPIFVFIHMPISNIVNGGHWATPQYEEIYSILKEYPQAVVFTGHSHYCMSDERAIMQKDFTVINTGTTSYFDFDWLDNEDENEANDFPADISQKNLVFQSQGLLDKKDYMVNPQLIGIYKLEDVPDRNNVNNGYLMYVDTQSNSFTLKKVNLNTGIEFGEKFTMRSFDKSSFTRTAEKLGSGVTPTFGGTEISAKSTSDGAVVSFDCACQNVPIKYYIYEIENEIGQKTYVRFFGKNYILGNDIMYTEQNKIRGLEKGKYFLHVYAVNSFNKVSDEYLTTEFTVK